MGRRQRHDELRAAQVGVRDANVAAEAVDDSVGGAGTMPSSRAGTPNRSTHSALGLYRFPASEAICGGPAYQRGAMSAFESYTCQQCAESFSAHPSARAARNEYCSPACESTGKGYR